MTTYQEKLRDPRWQKKRLEILSRDKWACQCCKSETKPLEVHHRFYNGKAPWEHDGDTLMTLCDVCHRRATKNRRIIDKILALVAPEHLSLVCLGIIEDIELMRDGQLDAVKAKVKAFRATHPEL